MYANPPVCLLHPHCRGFQALLNRQVSDLQPEDVGPQYLGLPKNQGHEYRAQIEA